ncbi:GNAT family N-acetyltransferase [Streptomyces beijiangensis]|uniref:GNAT family N-acetyltransferase n=1 Tax=Streptomyces beijiangensis TaxID=163361 RepID=A0A939JD15_9ACTN|nr:GNAT family N-acetyltransferase [Streptomyces beijiangensis]MBO0511561.1 GNAT family N-acetyltransferase [Streptomyces beijiangensis]
MTTATTEMKGLGLELRPWAPEDAATLLRGVTDPEFMRWNTPLIPITDLDGARESIAARAAARARDEMAQFAVWEEGGGEILGHVGLQLIFRAMRRTAIGYWTLPEHRGKGVAPRALELCTRWAFEQGGFHRIELGHAVENTPSCRVAVRAGYAVEGTLRGAMFESGKNDAFRDEHLHARLASDPYPEM